MLRGLSSLVGVLLASSLLPTTEAAATANWTNVRIGGGGYVLETLFHPTNASSAFARTDVGGAYRRVLKPTPDGMGVAWLPILDATPTSDAMYYSVYHMTLDTTPNSNGATAYALLGNYANYGPCRVSRTMDGGDNWDILLQHNWTLGCAGNGGQRALGDRVKVHPYDNNTIIIAGDDGRVYMTRDAFATAEQPGGIFNISFPGVTYPTSTSNVHSVDFLPLTTSGGASGPIAAIATVLGHGMFWSVGPAYQDPTTWAPVSGAPYSIVGNVSRLRVDTTGPYLLVSSAGGFGRFAVSSSSPSSPSLAVDFWQTPDNATYDGLAVDPANSLDMTFATIETDSHTVFRRTLDGGKTFFVLNWSTVQTVTWASDNTSDSGFGLQLNALSSVNYDPLAPSIYNATHVWVTDFFATWRCENWAAPAEAFARGEDPASVPVLFTSAVWGIEEVCVNFIKSPPNGLTLTGVADDFGWQHDSGLDYYPSKVYPTKDGHNCGFGSSYTLSTNNTGPNGGTVQDSIWITAGDEYGACRNGWCGLHKYVGVSKDGGATFIETTYDEIVAGDGGGTSNAYPYRIVTHPFNGNVAVISGYQGLPVVYTHDLGTTWGNATIAAGSPGAGELLPSVGPWGNFWFALTLERELNNVDTSPSTPATIYYYNGTTALFTSTDNGMTFSLTYNQFPTWNVPLFSIAVPPRGTAAPGDVWIFSGWKLYHSTNGGKNFSSVYQFYSVQATIAVGPLPNVTSRVTGRSAAEMSARCAVKGSARDASAATPRAFASPVGVLESDARDGRVVAYPTSSAGPAYVVYGIGTAAYGGNMGVFGSVDYGNTWIELDTATEALGDTPSVIEPSLSQPGLVFVGTEGRGSFYADLTEVLAEALEACED